MLEEIGLEGMGGTTNCDCLAHAGGDEDIDDGDIGIVVIDRSRDGEGGDGCGGGLHIDEPGVGLTELDARRRQAVVGVVLVGGNRRLVI